MKYYTIIGFKDTPQNIQIIQKQVATLLTQKGYTLRSCDAIGENPKTTIEFAICYTIGGRGKGSTKQALKILSEMNTPIFDCGKYDNMTSLQYSLQLFLKNVLQSA